jgi:acyl-CoA synthetase (AMP-forming)/AMP-acid ligase II
VKAVIVLRPGAKVTPAELVDYTKSKLASFKAPQYYAVVNELPRNPMGKVLKTDLRAAYGTPENTGV